MSRNSPLAETGAMPKCGEGGHHLRFIGAVVRAAALSVGLVPVVLVTPVVAGAASAVKSFTPSSSSITSAGRKVTLTAKVSLAKTCVFSLTPLIDGFPTTVQCSSSSLTKTIKVPANSVFYALNLGVKGLGDRASTTTRISQAAKALSGVASVVGQEDSYCAVLTSGAVDCWGFNSFGQLGNGTTTNSDRPTAVKSVDGSSFLTGVSNVASGSFGYGDSYCAVLTSGRVDCWGYNEDGQLGNGTTRQTDRPTVVKGVGGRGILTGVARVSGETYGFCAALTSGGVVCWGLNSDGELGNGTDENSSVPTAVVGVGGTGTLSGVASLVSEATTMCAILTSHGTDCWGYGPNGQLGNGTEEDSSFPTAVKGVGGTGTLNGVSSLTGNDNGTNICARLSSGRVDCWGDNSYGEIGNKTIGIFTDSSVPKAVVGVDGTGTLSGVASVVGVPGLSNCAILTSGGVDCWGSYGDGVLGNRSTNPTSDVPTRVVGVGGRGTLSKVTRLAGSICARLASGRVDCWGPASSSGYSSEPQAVVGVGGNGTLSGVRSLASDQNGSICAVQVSGSVDCWGSNDFGELGNGTTTKSSVPEVVVAAGQSTRT